MTGVQIFLQNSPNSVHTVGVLAVALGLAVCCAGNLDVYGDQLLCAGAVLGGCRLAPVQTKCLPAPLFAERNIMVSADFVSDTRKRSWWLEDSDYRDPSQKLT